GVGVGLERSAGGGVRVGEGGEVGDVCGDPHFQLTRDLGLRIGEVVRGALFHQGRLYLELRPESVGTVSVAPAAPPRVVTWLDSTEAPMLLIESGAQAFLLPLTSVLQISPRTPAFCPFPVSGSVVAGVVAHGQALWPVYALPAFFGEPPTEEPYLVLAELAGMQVALCASRVGGVET